MRPVSLEVEGIRSFRASQTIDFTGLSFFAILGDTGAGKSSILEAISYALFNSPTWFDRGVKELMSTGASGMRVRFTFRIADAECVITRLTPRAGTASHQLEYRGETPERRDGDGAVAHFVRQRLKLDRDTFMKTVMLPQGRFAELLLMKPADRSNFLSDVLGLYVIESMAETVRAPRDDTARRRDLLRGARRELPGDPAGEIAEAARLATAARGELNSIEESLRGVESLFIASQQDRSAAVAAEANREIVRSAVSTVNDLRALQTADERLREIIIQRERESEAADRRRSETAHSIETRRVSGNDAATLRRILADLQDIAKQKAVVAEEREERLQAETAVAALGSEAELIAREVEQSRELEIEADSACEAARKENVVRHARVVAVTTASKEIAAARTEFDRTKRALSEAEAGFEKAESAAAEADAAFRQRGALFEARAGDLESARRINSAAHAASGLHAGDRCPVCDRALPDPFVAPSSPKLREIEEAFKAAELARDAAYKELTGASASMKQWLVSRERLSAELVARGETLEHVVADSVQLNLSAVAEENEEVLLRESQLQTAEENALREATVRLAGARSSRERAERDHVAKLESLRHATGRVANAENRVTAVVRKIEALLASLPEGRRPALESTEAEIDLITADVRSALLEAESAEGSLATVEREFSDAQEALRHARDVWLKSVANPRRNAFEKVSRLVSDLLAPRGFDCAFPATDADFETLATFTDKLSLALSSADEHFGLASAAAKSRLVASDATMSETLRIYGVDSRASLQNLRDQRFAKATLAERAIVDAEERQRRAIKIDRRLELIEPVADVYAELAESLTPAQFPKFLVDRKQLELLRVGTTILGRMTADRYGFSAGLGIVDRTINQERKAHTLSGGETFLASLALSLALVEISERSGVRFESLFLDEGFGTLDPAAFEQALTELEHQVSQGRMIAVITHVARVREFIDDVLRVTKTAEGSEVVREQATTAA